MAWKCVRCGRSFEKEKQPHSCKIYPVEKHLAGKNPELYDKLRAVIRKNAGPFKVESLPCCIHFVRGTFTFAAVYVLKNKIKIHFGLNRVLKSSRINKSAKMSSTKYLYSVDVSHEKEIDRELLGWIAEAYNLK